jgi:nitric oxide reductase subunit C
MIMGFLLISFFIYTGFVYTIGTDTEHPSNPMNDAAVKGKDLFQQYNCISCHQVYGLGGYIGPDLTNAYSRSNQNTAYIKAMLQNGSARMPNFQMNDDQIQSITEYLKYLDRTGTSPVFDFKINYDGTITEVVKAK